MRYELYVVVPAHLWSMNTRIPRLSTGTTDLHNQGAVDTDAAMCSLLGHLWAIGRTFQETEPDGSMDYLPQWLQRTASDYLDELMEGMELHEEVLGGPTDKTFDFDDPEP